MTDPSFVASRLQGIGGSDIASLLSNDIEVEYGCRRRLWYRLSEYPADGADESTEPMQLGSLLEKYVLRAYSDKTGRPLEQFGLKKHPAISCLQYHDDAIAFPAMGETGKRVVECKAIGREMMAKVNAEGLCIDYVLQAQGGMACHGLELADFAVGMREDMLPLVAIELTARLAGEQIPLVPRQPKIVSFPVERSQRIVDLIETTAPKFWETLRDEKNIPPRLDIEDPRCGRCAYKVGCQGAALMASVQPEHSIPRRSDLLPIVEEYKSRKALESEVEALVTETENKFRQIFGSQTAFQVPVERDGKTAWKNILYRITKGRETIDGQRLLAAYGALRRAAVDAKVPGVELTPALDEFIRKGLPYRGLRLSAVLPKKEKKKGEVPETDGEEWEE